MWGTVTYTCYFYLEIWGRQPCQFNYDVLWARASQRENVTTKSKSLLVNNVTTSRKTLMSVKLSWPVVTLFYRANNIYLSCMEQDALGSHEVVLRQLPDLLLLYIHKKIYKNTVILGDYKKKFLPGGLYNGWNGQFIKNVNWPIFTGFMTDFSIYFCTNCLYFYFLCVISVFILFLK